MGQFVNCEWECEQQSRSGNSQINELQGKELQHGMKKAGGNKPYVKVQYLSIELALCVRRKYHLCSVISKPWVILSLYRPCTQSIRCYSYMTTNGPHSLCYYIPVHNMGGWCETEPTKPGRHSLFKNTAEGQWYLLHSPQRCASIQDNVSLHQHCLAPPTQELLPRVSAQPWAGPARGTVGACSSICWSYSISCLLFPCGLISYHNLFNYLFAKWVGQ